MKLEELLREKFHLCISDKYKDEFRILRSGLVEIQLGEDNILSLSPDESPIVFWSIVTSWLFCYAMFPVDEWKYQQGFLIEMRKSGISKEATMDYIVLEIKI